MSDDSVFIDPVAGEEYRRIPADEFDSGDEIESTDLPHEGFGLLQQPFGVVRGEFGWSANDRSVIRSYTIPGTSRKIALRMGNISVVLLDFFSWFDKNIESIDGGTLDDWGYAERTVRGSTTVMSRHAWGGAGDLNALKHPMGKWNTFTSAQRAKIRAKLTEYEGVIRWGGNYTSRPDDMHFEINAGPEGVRRIANKIRARKNPVVVIAPFGKTAKGDRILGLHNPPLTGNDVNGVRNGYRMLGNRIAATGPYDREMADLTNIFKQNRGITEKGFGADCWEAIRKVVHG